MSSLDLAPLDRHEKIALSFSGGKDSLACVYLLRDQLDRITIYHNDTGDLLPEVMEVVEHVKAFAPHFVHVRGDVNAWIAEHGLPTDLLPHGAHDVGRAMGEHQLRLVARYDCCYQNLMRPLFDRVVADGNTLLIRGTKAVDMKRLPLRSGESGGGIELFYPLQDWSHDAVFDYLRSVGAPICRVYDHVTNSPECARCSAWWSESRAAYLKRYHPAAFADYRQRLLAVTFEISGVLDHLRREVAEVE